MRKRREERERERWPILTERKHADEEEGSALGTLLSFGMNTVRRALNENEEDSESEAESDEEWHSQQDELRRPAFAEEVSVGGGAEDVKEEWETGDHVTGLAVLRLAKEHEYGAARSVRLSCVLLTRLTRY